MTRAAAVAIDNTFVGGLITEAGPLAFPENSAVAALNVDFQTTGRVKRRLGIDLEPGADQNDIGTSAPLVVNEYTWSSVANLGDLIYVAQQIGNIITFYLVSDGALSAEPHADTIDLDDYIITGDFTAETRPVDFSAGNGVLYIAHPACDPVYVEYDPDDDTFTGTAVAIKTRDFVYQDDALDVDERPASLTDLHKYNLYNQGWYFNTHAALSTWDGARSDFPSNADIWWVYKDSNEDFATGQIAKIDRGNSKAPNGHYIYDAFNVDRSTVSGVSNITTDSTDARPSSVCFFASRVFWGGVENTKFGNNIYFSPILMDIKDAGNCFQRNDPTSEDNSDLLPDDGGVIVIPNMGVLKKIIQVGPTVLCFASNGVWQISGSTGVGFAANDYAVSRISEVPAVGRMSFVVAENTVFWWNVDGIYVAAPSQQTGWQVTSVTENTIKTFYKSIPVKNVLYAKGVYDTLNKTLQWVYRSNTASDPGDNYKYDRALNFRLPTNAFFPFSLSQASGFPYVAGVIYVKTILDV